MLRKAFKVAFPETRFSVKISRYAGGSSIHIAWQDGPSEYKVRKVSSPFEGKGFDGMIDMEYSKYAWLLPDGSVTFAVTAGTEGSHGVVPFDSTRKPDPKAELVSFGCYVSEVRTLSEAKLQEIAVEYRKQYPRDPEVQIMPAVKYGWGWSSAYLNTNDRDVSTKFARILREMEGDPYYGN
jgi:hypothetical protein